MELHARDERSLATLVEELRDLHGGALQGVLLVGEAAGPEYRPRLSPLSLVVVLAEIDARGAAPHALAPRALAPAAHPGTAAVRRGEHRRSLDVFPLELLELRDRHRVLYGRVDALERIEVALPHLRLELEEQLRGKLLHLMAAYLEAGASPRALRRLLLDSTPGFNVLLRGAVHLRGGERASARPIRST